MGAVIRELERRRCLYPRCGIVAGYVVYGNDGQEEGEFCKVHARWLKDQIDMGKDVSFDYEKGIVVFE